MGEREDPELSEEARRRGREFVLVLVACALGGVVVGLLIKRWLGW